MRVRRAIALCAARSYIPIGHCRCGASRLQPEEFDMRAEIEKIVEEIKQSVGLLRRHL
jgi:hypothetical protein